MGSPAHLGLEVEVVSPRLTVFRRNDQAVSMIGPTLGDMPLLAREVFRPKSVAKALMHRAGTRVATARTFTLAEREAAWE